MPKPYIYKRAEDLGIPVVEAKERQFVTVTDSDVVLAKKADSKHCALARAALRLPDVNAAYFFRKTAFLEYENKVVRYLLPQSAQKEIVSFDRAQIFASGVYQLSPPPPSGTLKGKAKMNERRNKTPVRVLNKRERASLETALAQSSVGKPAPRAAKKISDARQRDLTNKIDRIAKVFPVGDETQRQFDDRMRSIVHDGGRTVSGIKKPSAPEPLAKPRAGGGRYSHRTQYVRDLKEPL